MLWAGQGGIPCLWVVSLHALVSSFQCLLGGFLLPQVAFKSIALLCQQCDVVFGHELWVSWLFSSVTRLGNVSGGPECWSRKPVWGVGSCWGPPVLALPPVEGQGEDTGAPAWEICSREGLKLALMRPVICTVL